MIRTAIITLVIFSGGFLMSNFYVGYPRAGKYYIAKHREKRKSLRTGSSYYGAYYGSRSFRGGGK